MMIFDLVVRPCRADLAQVVYRPILALIGKRITWALFISDLNMVEQIARDLQLLPSVRAPSAFGNLEAANCLTMINQARS
jgi:hypothetical protein